MSVIVLLAAFLCLGEASLVSIETFKAGITPTIIGGTDSAQGNWPWMLNLQDNDQGAWGVLCGASLLSSTKGITAAHCVDGRSASSLRVVAGMYHRTDYTGTQIADITSFAVHEEYDAGSTVTYANDIATLHWSTAITENSNVQFATLPPNNADDFSWAIGVIIGWGRYSSAMTYADILQEANSPVIGLAVCQQHLAGIAEIWANQICVYDGSNTVAVCNGDSGGPLMCPISGGGYYVCGIMSFGVVSGGDCDPSKPTVSTRTGSYITWISNN